MVRYEANPFPAGKSWGIGQGPPWPRGYCPSDSTSQSSYFYVKIACFFTRPDDIDIWVRVICRKLFYLKICLLSPYVLCVCLVRVHMFSPLSFQSRKPATIQPLGPGRNVLLYLSARCSSINRQRSPLHNTKTYVYNCLHILHMFTIWLYDQLRYTGGAQLCTSIWHVHQWVL